MPDFHKVLEEQAILLAAAHDQEVDRFRHSIVKLESEIADLKQKLSAEQAELQLLKNAAEAKQNQCLKKEAAPYSSGGSSASGFESDDGEKPLDKEKERRKSLDIIASKHGFVGFIEQARRNSKEGDSVLKFVTDLDDAEKKVNFSSETENAQAAICSPEKSGELQAAKRSQARCKTIEAAEKQSPKLQQKVPELDWAMDSVSSINSFRNKARCKTKELGALSHLPTQQKYNIGECVEVLRSNGQWTAGFVTSTLHDVLMISFRDGAYKEITPELISSHVRNPQKVLEDSPDLVVAPVAPTGGARQAGPLTRAKTTPVRAPCAVVVHHPQGSPSMISLPAQLEDDADDAFGEEVTNFAPSRRESGEVNVHALAQALTGQAAGRSSASSRRNTLQANDYGSGGGNSARRGSAQGMPMRDSSRRCSLAVDPNASRRGSAAAFDPAMSSSRRGSAQIAPNSPRRGSALRNDEAPRARRESRVFVHSGSLDSLNSRRGSAMSHAGSYAGGEQPFLQDDIDADDSDGVQMPDEVESESDLAEFCLLWCWTNNNVNRGRSVGKLLEAGFTLQNLAEGAAAAAADDYMANDFFAVIMDKPSSRFHIFWQAVCLLLILKDSIMVPLEVFELSEGNPVGAVPLISLFFWILDVFISFRTGYLNTEGAVELRITKVARRYCKTWLPVDSMCLLSDWGVLLTHISSEQDNLLAKAARALRGLRLMRLVKVQKLSAIAEEHIRSEMTKLMVGILKIIFFLIWMAHVVACAWYGLGARIHMDTMGPDSWISRLGLRRAGMMERYVWSMHWALAQFVGENLFEVQTVPEHIFAALVLLFAYLFSMLLVSTITTAMTRIQVITGQQAADKLSLRRYLIDNDISNSLSMRVQRNAQFSVDELKRQAPESSISLLKLVSEPLRVELHFELHSPTLMAHPFFEHYEEVNSAGMREVTHLAISYEKFSHGDIIFSNQETPTRPRMFFVTGEGCLQYFGGGDNALNETRRGSVSAEPVEKSGTKLTDGSWVGEAVLWTTWMHRGQLRVKTDCTVLCLDAEQFQKIVSCFPTPHARDYGEAFVEALNEVASADLTDIQNRGLNLLISQAFHDGYNFGTDTSRLSGVVSNCTDQTPHGPGGAAKDFVAQHSPTAAGAHFGFFKTKKAQTKFFD